MAGIDDFLEKHRIQLFGMNFPEEIFPLLYQKLTSEIFDTGNFFKIMQKANEYDEIIGQEVLLTRDLHPFSNVFLIDHAWSTRLADMRTTISNNERLLERLEGIARIIPEKMEIPGIQEEKKAGVFQTYSLDIENQGIDEIPTIMPGITMLSLWGNNFSEFNQFENVLGGLKALWLNENPISENEAELFEFIENNFKNIEILNSKLTKNAGTWALQYLGNTLDLNSVSHIDFSDRQINRIDPEILKKIPNAFSIDMTGNVITNEWLVAINKYKILKIDGNYEELIWNTLDEFPNLKYLNGNDTVKGKPSPIDLVIEKLWKYFGTYRLATSSQYDETSVWYILDEFGCSISHSDIPNFALAPFLYIPPQGEPISYSLLWPIIPALEGEVVTRNFLSGITEEQFRSYRLYLWYKIPREPIDVQYQKWVKSLGANSPVEIEKSDNGPEILEIPLKIATDLDFFKRSLTDPRFVISEPEEANALWIRGQLFIGGLKEYAFSSDLFINQFPYEGCLVMKNQLAKTIQQNAKVNWLPLTFELDKELPALMGEYLKRKDNGDDNHWILKPINMSRSLDTWITNSLDSIIKVMETGPKICQKYITRPLLINGKKFDLRFIVLLKSISPLKVYVYDRFWVRSSNNPFTLTYAQDSVYETHFTVMNYSGHNLKKIMDTELAELYEQQHGLPWKPVQDSIYKAIKECFTIAATSHPQMHNPKSRAIYGLDVMLDENKQPYILEVNFCPDCERAVTYFPEFANEIFSCLFFDETKSVIEL